MSNLFANASASFAGNSLARLLLLAVVGVISLAPGAELQSYLLTAAYVALASFIVVHSHHQRKRTLRDRRLTAQPIRTGTNS